MCDQNWAPSKSSVEDMDPSNPPAEEGSCLEGPLPFLCSASRPHTVLNIPTASVSWTPDPGTRRGGAAAPRTLTQPCRPGCHLLQQLTTTPHRAGVTFNTARSHPRLTAQGGPSRAACSRTPRVELLSRQLFSRFSRPHLQTCYFWRERHCGAARAWRSNGGTCLYFVGWRKRRQAESWG